MLPADGCTKPLSTLKKVVLPAPLGPTRPHTPAGSSNVTPSSGLTPPKETVRSRTSSIVVLRGTDPGAQGAAEALELAGDPLWSGAHRVHETEAEHHEDEVAVHAELRQQ